MSAQTFHATLDGETIKVRSTSREKAMQKTSEIFADRRAGIVQRRRNRLTGTEILIVDRNLLGGPEGDGNDNRWETICDEHGTVCSHDTRALAESHAADPTGWCEPCQAAYTEDHWNEIHENTGYVPPEED